MIKNEDIKIGEHCWAIMENELLIVLKKKRNSFAVCGYWDGIVYSNEIKIISIIEKPEEYKEVRLYY